MRPWSRDSADVGDGGAGIGPVTYPTPFPDPPVSSPGNQIPPISPNAHAIVICKNYLIQLHYCDAREKNKKAYKPTEMPGFSVSCCATVGIWSEREMRDKQTKG